MSNAYESYQESLVRDAVELASKVMRIMQLEAMLQDCLIYFEERSDVVDGPDGPEPNRAMSMASAIEKVLKG